MIEHKKYFKSGKQIYVIHALSILGLNYFKGKANTLKDHINHKRIPTFWRREDLDFIFQDARKAYLECAKIYHPDRGGSKEKMQEINLAWNFIRREFERRGFTLN